MATYSLTADVKQKLVKFIDSTDLTEDTYIGKLRDRYYAYINSQLRQYGASLPLTAASDDYDIITEIEALYSAGAWIMERLDSMGTPEEEKATLYDNKADKMLKGYIDSHFLNGSGILYHYRGGNSWQSSPIDTQ